MIRSFRDAEAEKLFNDEFSRQYRVIGNHLEALKGDRKGQHSIRINDQYRLCFVWADGHATDVEIVDYHS